MKKHSPNFFENLQEADTAKNNRSATFFWTVVLVAVLMLGLSVTKTKAQTYELGIYRVPSEHDTIPVKMIVSDSSGNVLQVLDGYQATDAIEPNFTHEHTLNQCMYRTYKTTYLNHKKQLLPDRLIVWMAIRRNEK